MALKHSKSLLVVSNPASHALSAPKQVKFELFIGNLRQELSTRALITELQQFFATAGIHIPDFRFIIFQRRSKKKLLFKYAFVTVTDRNEEEKILEYNGAENLRFISKNGRMIVQRRICAYHNSSANVKLLFNGAVNTLKNSKSAPGVSFSSHSFESIGRLMTYQKELYLGQYLPAEDRVTEYKRGSGKYMKNMLINHVRKYICAFLNSKGGRLMIGVDDNCKVYGVSCTRKQEDQARCLIDNTVKHFKPHVSPNLYIIDFIPVKISAYDQIDIDASDSLLKVVEISVQRPNGAAVLYANDRGDIYIRRDGSIEGPLKTMQIVEWCRNIYSTNVGSSDGCSEVEQTSVCNYRKDNVVLARDSCTNDSWFRTMEHHLLTIITKLEDQLIRQADQFNRRETFYMREIEYVQREAAYYKEQAYKSKCQSDKSICNII